MSSPRGFEEARICDMTVGCKELRRVAAAGDLDNEGKDVDDDGCTPGGAEKDVESVFGVVLELKELMSGGMVIFEDEFGRR